MKQQNANKSLQTCSMQRYAIGALIGLLAAISCACGSTPVLKTTTVKFRCDSQFNSGLRLPVDLVFIPEGERVDTITKVAPDEWFDSDQREQWQFKQSLSLVENGERNDVEIKLTKPARTIGLVIMADFLEIKEAKQQIIILDTGAKENEDVFVTINGILHSAK